MGVKYKSYTFAQVYKLAINFSTDCAAVSYSHRALSSAEYRRGNLPSTTGVWVVMDYTRQRLNLGIDKLLIF